MRRRLASAPLALVALAALLDVSQVCGARLLREEPAGPCSCDCCEVEEARDAAPQGGLDLALQCAYAPPGDLYSESSHTGKCSTLCTKEDDDNILSASESGTLDTQRFCFFECEPGRQGLEEQGEDPQRGDPCQPLGKREASVARDASGNARGGQFLSRRVEVAYAAGAPAPAAAAAAPGPAPGPGAEWSSIADPIPEHVARFVEWAQDAQKKAEKAAEDTKAIDKLATKAAEALPVALRHVGEAKMAADDAHKAELRVRKILESAKKEAFKEALSLVPDVLQAVEAKAHAKAKADGAAKGAKLKGERISQVPSATEAAMQPYQQAMQRAVASSAAWSSQGDSLVGQSLQLQAEAQALQGQAEAWNHGGDTAKAQRLMQQSRKMMNMAKAFNSQASSAYSTAAGIDGTLGGYEAQAGQAAWNAEKMLNPDAAAPLPLVDMR